jgi:hypothetical protein
MLLVSAPSEQQRLWRDNGTNGRRKRSARLLLERSGSSRIYVSRMDPYIGVFKTGELDQIN